MLRWAPLQAVVEAAREQALYRQRWAVFRPAAGPESASAAPEGPQKTQANSWRASSRSLAATQRRRCALGCVTIDF